MTSTDAPTRSNGAGEALRDDFRRGREEAQQLGSEFGEMVNDLRYLMQKEAELARAEIEESVNKATQSAISGVIAIVFANIFLIFAFATVMFALETVFDMWLAALITTGILLVITAAALLFARARMKQVSITPKRTMQSLREDMEWAKTQMPFTTR